MANQANIKAVITADDRASSTLKKFGNNTSALGDKLGVALKGAAIGAAAAGAAAIAFGAVSVKAFSEAEDAIAQTNAVIKSTGGVAGVTEKAVDDLSKSLQRQTKYSDEEVRSAQNLLLTFTKISKDIFPGATKTVLDMSTALGQDLKSSSIQVGKALQDPVLGVTALRRVGVNFSDKQRDVIKRLVETGKAAEAQKMILQELATEFGGSATAAGKTFSGQLQILKNNFNDLQEVIGSKLTGSLQLALSSLNAWYDKMGGAEGIYDSAVAWLDQLRERLIYVKDVIVNLFGPSINALVNTFREQLLPSLKELWAFLGPVLVPLLKLVGQVIGATVIGAIWVFINALNVLLKIIKLNIDAFLWFKDGVVSNIKVLAHFAGVLYDAFKRVFDMMGAGFQKAGGAISGIKDTLHKLKIPGFATGTNYAPGGLAMVGERGPELVNLPRGSQVIPNNKIQGGSSQTINITIQAGVMTGTESDMRKLSNMVADGLKDVASSKGMTTAQLLGGL